ncbi:hypothetical protein HXA34_20700 [Salipaludibacillus agaradhaerens]|jgi:hypothetical protein|uniref:hypothetical protein n=1 Tax=Salipaludibacillus agaradhaerens TaxID=76935 RepID=UPI002150C7B3|nr:hypothetical protein [Salipaludibacillus agaradhaerens]MCR6108720.1 hypothetical protein [Salipaludibacillus agaradhaerens]MCR6120743.1 hypothetical protein [Salipaludibacillus agaradhaerens]
MSEFDIGLDIEAELAGIRGHSKERSHESSNQSKQGSGATSGQTTTTKTSEPEVLSHSHGGEGAPSTPTPVTKENKEATPLIDWKQFKTLPGVFEHVGGDRPVRLASNIKKSHATGIPEPLLVAVQQHLQKKYIGAVVSFPWGEYEVTEKNRVFTTRSSLIRYLLFDGLRDTQGTHLQYAKQWMVLHHPVFDQGFDPETHLGAKSDELDIYTLLFVSHASEGFGSKGLSNTAESEQDHQTAERIGMLNMEMSRVLDKLDEQERLLREYADRQTIIQTVMLLDRMGLLNGGLPRDVGEFVRVLEENRDVLAKTETTVSHHIQAEKERQKAFARQERLRKMQQR